MSGADALTARHLITQYLGSVTLDKNTAKTRKEAFDILQAKLLFSNDDGTHISFYTYNKYLHENSLSALHRAITPHTLRHTHASLLMEQGIGIDAISRRLGHEDSKITREIYLHVTEN